MPVHWEQQETTAAAENPAWPQNRNVHVTDVPYMISDQC